MAAKVQVKCQNKKCGCLFMARVADRKRGWAKFCSKSCKAVKQEALTGQYKAYLNGEGVSNLHPERIFDCDEVDISDSDFGASDGGCLRSDC